MALPVLHERGRHTNRIVVGTDLKGAALAGILQLDAGGLAWL